MELLEGVDLRTELEQKGRLSSPRALEILRGVCAALDAAHQGGMTHRDIKPANIFLARSMGAEIPKVLDFGVAKFASTSAPTQSLTATDTGTGHLIGTLRYMSPEQLRGEPPGARWDLWALAVTTYEMLTGEYPFAGAATPAWHAAVMAGRFTPPNRHLSSAPPEWDDYFGRALAADAEWRPATASAFLADAEKSLT